MGGKTFGRGDSLTPSKTNEVVDDIISMLHNEGVDINYMVTRSVDTKMTSSDIDIRFEEKKLGDTSTFVTTSVLSSIFNVLSKHMECCLHEGGLNVLYDGKYQVDFRGTPNLETCCFIHSFSLTGSFFGACNIYPDVHFSDLGLVLSLTANFVKGYAAHLPDHLSNRLRSMKSFPKSTIILTDDTRTICRFLGVDYEEYLKGFDTDEDYFKWLTASHFNADFSGYKCGHTRTNNSRYKLLTKYYEEHHRTPSPQRYHSVYDIVSEFEKHDEVLCLLDSIASRCSTTTGAVVAECSNDDRGDISDVRLVVRDTLCGVRGLPSTDIDFIATRMVQLGITWVDDFRVYFNRAVSLVTSTYPDIDLCDDYTDKFHNETLVSHLFCAGIIMVHLVHKYDHNILSVMTEEQVFQLGFFHDIGKYLVKQPNKASRIYPSHAQVGETVCRKLGLHEHISVCTSFHMCELCKGKAPYETLSAKSRREYDLNTFLHKMCLPRTDENFETRHFFLLKCLSIADNYGRLSADSKIVPLPDALPPFENIDVCPLTLTSITVKPLDGGQTSQLIKMLEDARISFFHVRGTGCDDRGVDVGADDDLFRKQLHEAYNGMHRVIILDTDQYNHVSDFRKLLTGLDTHAAQSNAANSVKVYLSSEFKNLPGVKHETGGTYHLGFCDVQPVFNLLSNYNRQLQINVTSKEEALIDILMKFIEDNKLDVTPRIAGGWVRDKLLGRQSNDIDIMLDNMSGHDFVIQLKRALDDAAGSASGAVDPIDNAPLVDSVYLVAANPEKSKHLSTATANVAGFAVDFVQSRVEEYAADSRIPEVRVGSARDDALRRDFTINSLFYNLKTRSVEDFTGMGVADLRDRVLRTPTDPAKTFEDDPLRVIRAVRMALRYNLAIHPPVAAAMRAGAIKFRQKVSRERVYSECKKMSADSLLVAGLKKLHELGILDLVIKLPQTGIHLLDEKCMSDVTIWSALTFPSCQIVDIKQLLIDELKMSTKTIKDICTIHKATLWIMKYEIGSPLLHPSLVDTAHWLVDVRELWPHAFSIVESVTGRTPHIKPTVVADIAQLGDVWNMRVSYSDVFDGMVLPDKTKIKDIKRCLFEFLVLGGDINNVDELISFFGNNPIIVSFLSSQKIRMAFQDYSNPSAFCAIWDQDDTWDRMSLGAWVTPKEIFYLNGRHYTKDELLFIYCTVLDEKPVKCNDYLIRLDIPGRSYVDVPKITIDRLVTRYRESLNRMTELD